MNAVFSFFLIESEDEIMNTRNIWDEIKHDERTKLILAYILLPTLSKLLVIYLTVFDWEMPRVRLFLQNLSFASLFVIDICLMLPASILRFMLFKQGFKYGGEIYTYTVLSVAISIILVAFLSGYLITPGTLTLLSVYLIISYKGIGYNSMSIGKRYTLLFFTIVLCHMWSGVVYFSLGKDHTPFPTGTAIVFSYILMSHTNSNKTSKNSLQDILERQSCEALHSNDTSGQTMYRNQPPEPTHSETSQEPEPPEPPQLDRTDTLIDIGLAHIGRTTALDNPYITPEQTQSRHNAERPFTKLLARRYTDANTRKALARHFMLYKEVTLFVIFAMGLKNDKPLHSKIQSRLKVRLSLGLPSKTIASRNEYWRKLSDKFNESYTRTKDLAGTLDYVFWSVLPEKLKGEGFADLTGNGYLRDIFDYTREAVIISIQELDTAVKHVENFTASKQKVLLQQYS